VTSNTKNTANIGCLESEFGIVCKPREIAQSFAKYFQTAVMKLRNNLSSLHNAASLSAKATGKLYFFFYNKREICLQEAKENQNI
jgi:hypothetical protein